MTGMRNKNVPDPSNLTTVSQIMEICEMVRSSFCIIVLLYNKRRPDANSDLTLR